MDMDTTTRATLAANVRRPRELRGLSQTALGNRAGIGQTTVSAMEDPTGKASSVNKIEAVARALQCEPWMLLVPGLPDEILLNQSLSRVIRSYAEVPVEGRTHIERVAESEARYAAITRESHRTRKSS